MSFGYKMILAGNMGEYLMSIKQPLLILSIASKFSKNGIYFYNNLFHTNKINAVYRSCPISSLESFRCAVEFLDVYAASIASPFKLEILDKIDLLTKVADVTKSVNCVKRVNNLIEGHNSDAIGLIDTIRGYTKELEKNPTFLIYGTGGVVPSVIYALRNVFKEPMIYISGRNKDKVKEISGTFNLNQIDDPLKVKVNLWINATPASVDNPDEILKICLNSSIVFDLNPVQKEYRFESEIMKRNQKFIRGFDFYIKQFVEQYEFFIDEKISEEDIRKLAKLRNDV